MKRSDTAKPASNGKPVAKQPAPTPSRPHIVMAELGRTGLLRNMGILDEETLKDLRGSVGAFRGSRAVQVYREMSDNDATIGGLLNAIVWLARQTEWRIEGDDEARAEFIDSCRRDLNHPWSDLIAEILRGMLVYGWEWHETVYKLRQRPGSQFSDGLIGWAKFPVRAQSTLQRWIFDEPANPDVVIAMEQVAPPDYRPRQIPKVKSLHLVTETCKDNPEGRSILRNCYRSWYFKKHIEQIEAIGVERDLAGLPIIWVPSAVFDDATQVDEYKKIATNIRRDEQEGIVMPLAYDEGGHKLFDVTLLSTGGQRQFDTSTVIQRYDRRILQTALADFLEVGHEKVGSFALASSKTNLFAYAMGAWLDQIAGAFNRHAIPALLELNGLSTEDAPELKHGDIEQRDLAELGAYLGALAAAGMPLFPDPELENMLRAAGGLPTLSPEEMREREAQADAEQEAAAEAERARMEANGHQTEATDGQREAERA